MRRSWLRRKTPLKRGTALLRRTPLKSRTKSTGPPSDAVDVVYARSGWSCELDGAAVGSIRGVGYHLHHRRPRAAGGTVRPDTNSPSNLLLLCPPCHRDVESRRAEALEFGWLVPQCADPAAVAVLICRSRFVYLGPNGTYSDHPPTRKES